MKIGIVGLGAAGKTSCFNALTGATVATGGFGKDTNTGILPVPDQRLARLSSFYDPKKTTPATIEFTDIPGLGSQSGGEFGRKALGDIRDMDALLLLLRLFQSDNVPHPEGGIDPVRDLELIEMQLRLADLDVIDRRLERIGASIRKAPKDQKESLEKENVLLVEIKQLLEDGKPVEVDEEGRRLLAGYGFFALKPVLWLVNVSDLTDESEAASLKSLQQMADSQGISLVVMNATLESELTEFDEEERQEYYDAVGLSGPAAPDLIQRSYATLGLISFFTVGEDECRAWTIKEGANAQKAAGCIHSDLERGFIRAEVIAYDDFDRVESFTKAKEAGVMRLEGKEYIVNNGDVIVVHFSV
jgi:ribosome-binding ATPase